MGEPSTMPPHREMPPEVRARLRERVRSGLSDRRSPRGPMLAAAAIVVLAATGAAALLATHQTGQQPPSNTSSAAQRMSDECHVAPGSWQPGAFLQRANGDQVQLGVRDDLLALCLITHSHPTPNTWFTMVTQKLDTHTHSFNAALDNGLVFGNVAAGVASVTVEFNGEQLPGAIDNGTFVVEVNDARSVTVTTRDAQGKVLDQHTVS